MIPRVFHQLLFALQFPIFQWRLGLHINHLDYSSYDRSSLERGRLSLLVAKWPASPYRQTSPDSLHVENFLNYKKYLPLL